MRSNYKTVWLGYLIIYVSTSISITQDFIWVCIIMNLKFRQTILILGFHRFFISLKPTKEIVHLLSKTIISILSEIFFFRFLIFYHLQPSILNFMSKFVFNCFTLSGWIWFLFLFHDIPFWLSIIEFKIKFAFLRRIMLTLRCFWKMLSHIKLL